MSAALNSKADASEVFEELEHHRLGLQPVHQKIDPKVPMEKVLMNR